MNTKSPKQFLTVFKKLYITGKRHEAVVLMRDFFKGYRSEDKEVNNCLLRMARLSENWKDINSPEAYYINAYAKTSLLDFAGSIKDAIKATELKPDFKFAYSLTGFTYSHLQEYSKAIEYYTKAIQLDPSNSNDYIGLGNAYSHLQEYSKAIEYYIKAIQLEPEFFSAYYGLGHAYRNLNEPQKAIEYYTKAIEIDPKKIISYYGLAFIYKELKEFSKSIELFNKVIHLDPNYIHAYNWLGNIYSDLKDYKKAVEYYKKTIHLNANYDHPYNGLGNVYCYLKEYPKAIEYYRKAIEINPSYALAYIGIANVHNYLGEYEKAIENYNKAIEIDPNYKFAIYNRALTYKILDDYKNAISDYQKYIDLSFDDSDIYYTWAKDNIEELNKKLDNKEYEVADRLISQIKEILKFKNQCLTHYTGISVASKLIISGGKLRLSEGSFLNDTSEGRKLFDFLEWHIKPKSNDETLSEIFTEKPFIGSFVAEHEHNNLTLWRMYGKEQQAEAKGCAITINKEKLVEEIRKELGLDKKDGGSLAIDDLFIFYNVAYRNNNDLVIIPGARLAQNNKLNKLLKELKEKISVLTPDKKEGRVGQLITESLNTIAFLFKTSEYQYEHEVRLVIRDIDFFPKTIDENFKPPRVYIELTNILPAVVKVTLGPKVDRPDEWAAAFNYTFKKQGLQPEIIMSHLPYK